MKQPLQILHQFYWIAQLGFSLVTPPLLCVALALWLQSRFDLGAWVILLGLFFGLGAAGVTFYSFAQQITKRQKRNQPKQPDISFRNHE